MAVLTEATARLQASIMLRVVSYDMCITLLTEATARLRANVRTREMMYTCRYCCSCETGGSIAGSHGTFAGQCRLRIVLCQAVFASCGGAVGSHSAAAATSASQVYTTLTMRWTL